MNDILTLIILTLMPLLELRASIPYGLFKTDLPVSAVFAIAVLANIVLGPILFFFFNYLVQFFLKVSFIDRVYQKLVVRTQHKVQKYVEKYGVLGLAIFIGIPLPGSGVYTGALGAYLLGFQFKDFLKATILGVLIAGVIVLLVSLAGNGAWAIFVKKV